MVRGKMLETPRDKGGRMEIDIGARMSELLGKLAEKIGTTADTIFPWYVKQQIIEGYIFIFLSWSFFVLSGLVCWRTFRKADFKAGDQYAVVCIASAILFGISVMVFCGGASTMISQIINPHYYAFHQLTLDLSRLMGK